jgi:hypothetical protein
MNAANQSGPAMRLPRVWLRARTPSVAVLRTVIIGPLVLVRRRDNRSSIAVERHQKEARARSDEQYADAMIAVTDIDACSLGERQAVEVEGKPLIVDDYAAFPALMIERSPWVIRSPLDSATCGSAHLDPSSRSPHCSWS